MNKPKKASREIRPVTAKHFTAMLICILATSSLAITTGGFVGLAIICLNVVNLVFLVHGRVVFVNRKLREKG